MKEHILERIAELRRLSDRMLQGGKSDPANGIVNSILDSLLEIRDLAREELAWCHAAEPQTPQDQVSVSMWRYGAAMVELAIDDVLRLARLQENPYRAFLDKPEDPARAKEQEERTFAAGGAMAWMLGIEDTIRGFMADPDAPPSAILH